jgi:hypothetical protein
MTSSGRRTGGAAALATIPAGPSSGDIDWPQSGGNPSEHTVTATAQIHDSIGAITLNSLDAPNRPYNTSGMGRPADDIIASLQMKSLDYVNAYTLRTQASASPAPSPDPAVVPEPQFVWDTSGKATSTFGAAAGDIQGQKPSFFLTPYSFTGTNATVGYKLKVQANPNTLNAQGQPDALLTLYDNTSGNPATLPAGGVGFNGPVALYSKVAKYSLIFSALSLWVEFTKLPSPVWQQVGPSYASSSQPLSSPLYAVLAAPEAPMTQPWVGVLEDACTWAKGTADAVSATTAVTKGLYSNGHYDPANAPTYVTIDTATLVEEFKLQSFLAGVPPTYPAPSGQCNDFADFLVCLSNSLGAMPLKSQRQNNPFATKPVTYAPSTTSATGRSFLYHIWTTDGTSATVNGHISDGALRFDGVTPISNLTGPLSGTSYYNSLVLTPPSAGWTDDLRVPYIPEIVN